MRQGTSLGRVMLDIETTALKPGDGSIVSIQTKCLDDPKGILVVRRAWRHPDGEAGVVRDFFEWSRMATSRWHLLPVGYNLSFEWKWLHAKGVKYGCIPFGTNYADFADRPQIDLHPVIVAFNGFDLSGTRLDDWTGKCGHGANAAEYAAGKRWAELDAYIASESAAFEDLYRALKSQLPALWNSHIAPKMKENGDTTKDAA